MITADQQRFCEQTLRAAQALGIGGRRYEIRQGAVVAQGFEFCLPSGAVVRGEAFLGLQEPRALHSACKALAEKLAD
jgi:hypothetical protein